MHLGGLSSDTEVQAAADVLISWTRHGHVLLVSVILNVWCLNTGSRSVLHMVHIIADLKITPPAGAAVSCHELGVLDRKVKADDHKIYRRASVPLPMKHIVKHMHVIATAIANCCVRVPAVLCSFNCHGFARS